MGVQNKLPGDVLLWCMDCLQLRAVLALGSRETSAPPFYSLEELELGALPIMEDYQR